MSVNTNFVLPPSLNSTRTIHNDSSTSNYYHALHSDEEEELEEEKYDDDDKTIVTSNISDTDDDWSTDDSNNDNVKSETSTTKILRNNNKSGNITRQQAWNSIITINKLQDLPTANVSSATVTLAHLDLESVASAAFSPVHSTLAKPTPAHATFARLVAVACLLHQCSLQQLLHR